MKQSAWNDAAALTGEVKILFQRTGAEVKEAIEKKIREHVQREETLTSELGEICRRRELDVAEVLEADDDEKVQQYSSKAANSIGSARTNSIVRELQLDLDKIRQHSRHIALRRAAIERLQLLARVIRPTESWALTYGELVLFGF